MSGPFHVRLTEAAEHDLEAITDYIASHYSPEYALELLAELQALTESLSQFPLRGNIPKELEALGISTFRQIIHQRYRLFYHVQEQQVTILLITDGRRDMQAMLEQRLLGG